MRDMKRRGAVLGGAALAGAFLAAAACSAAAQSVERVCLAMEEKEPPAKPERMRLALDLIGVYWARSPGEAAEGMRCWARRAETPAPTPEASARLEAGLKDTLGPALVLERAEGGFVRVCLPIGAGQAAGNAARTRSVFEYLRALLGPSTGVSSGELRCYARRADSPAPAPADQAVLVAKLREAAGTLWLIERGAPSSGEKEDPNDRPGSVGPDAIMKLGLKDALAGDGRAFDGSRAAAAASLVPLGIAGVGGTGLPTPAGLRKSAGTVYPEARTLGGPGEAGLPTPAPDQAGFRPRPVPAPAVRYTALIDEEARAAGLDPKVLRVIVAVKSGFRADIQSGNAYGLMLVSPGAAAEVGLKGADLNDPEVNLRVGARYLAKLKERLGGNLHVALAAYEVGLGPVLDAGGNIPNHPRAKRFIELYEKEYRKGPRKPAVKPVNPSGLLDRLGAVLREPGSRRMAGRVENDPWARYLPTVKALCEGYGVDAPLAEALLRTENGWADPRALSSDGAMGLGQLMPKTGVWLGVRDPFNAEQSLDGSMRYQRYLIDRFGGDRVLAVAAYHGGEGNIGRAGGVVPAGMPKTVRYVVKVFDRYRGITGEAVPYERYFRPARIAAFTAGP